MITFWWRSTFRGTKTLDLSKIIGQHERILVSWWSALSEHLEKCLLIADEFTGCERMFNMDWKDRVRFNSSSHMQPQPSGTTAMHQRISWATPQEIWSPTLLHRPCFLDLPHGFFKHLILCCFIFLSKNDFNPSIYYPQKKIGHELLLSVLNYHQICDLPAGIVTVKMDHFLTLSLFINSTPHCFFYQFPPKTLQKYLCCITTHDNSVLVFSTF